MPQIEVHSSTIYIDPIILTPTSFHSNAPSCSPLICHLSGSFCLAPFSISLKGPNCSALICHLSRSNLFGPYSIPLKSPQFQFTYLPFIQIQSFWPLLNSTQKPPNSSSLIYHLYRSNLFGPYSIPLKC